MSYISKAEMQEFVNQRMIPIETSVQKIRESVDEALEKVGQLEFKVLARESEYQQNETRIEEIAAEIKSLKRNVGGFGNSWKVRMARRGEVEECLGIQPFKTWKI